MCRRNAIGGLALTIMYVLWSPTAVGAEDLSAYRGFRLGMSVVAVARHAGLPAATATVVLERPVRIEELEWRPRRVAGNEASQDSVDRVLFGFYNGELYRIVVTYDPDRTEGLTEQDIIEVLSTAYGRPTTPLAKIITSTAMRVYTDTETVTARWEDAVASVNLFHGTYRSGFGLVVFSKRTASLARVGIDEGMRLAQLDAPRREAAEQKQRDDIEKLARAKARIVNKLAFKY